MGLLSFSNTKKGRRFSLSLIIFTVFSLTNVFRGLSVIGIQMPIILVCYILLLSSCSSEVPNNSTSRVVGVTFLLFFFDLLFIYTQDAARFATSTFINKIGFNYSIFVSFFPVLYAVSGNLAIIDKRKFLNFVYVVAFVTAITTIMGSFAYESPCRELATPDNLEIDRLYKSRNIGGYGFIYFLVLLTPVVLKDLIQRKSLKNLILFVTFGFCIVRSEYTTALLLFIVAIGLVTLSFSKSVIVRLVILGVFITSLSGIQGLLNSASTYFSDSSYMMSKRFEMMSDYGEYGDADGDLEIRMVLYYQSIEAFLHNPLFGRLLSFEHRPLGGHSELLDFIGNSGLLGIIALSALISYLRKKTPVRRINMKDAYIKCLFIVAVILALINTFLTPELYYAILIIPLLVDDETNEKGSIQRYAKTFDT